MTNVPHQTKRIYHQRPASTAAEALCGSEVDPDRTVNNYKTDIPAGGRMCLRCLRRLRGLPINARMKATPK